MIEHGADDVHPIFGLACVSGGLWIGSSLRREVVIARLAMTALKRPDNSTRSLDWQKTSKS
jgi:hypothetical protein